VAPISYPTAVLGIIVGTLAAILVLPADYFEPGQLQMSAICLSAGLLSGPLLSSLTDLRGWLRAESIMMVGLVYWLMTEVLGSSYTAYQLTRDGVVSSFAYIAAFAIAIQFGSWLAHHWWLPRKVRPPVPDFSAEWLFSALLVCSGLGLLARLIPCEFSPVCIADGLLGSREVGAWNQTTYGNSSSFVYHLGYFGYLTLPLTVALHHRAGRFDWRVIIGLLLTIFFMLFLIKDGGRRLVGMVAGSGLLTWLLLQPRMGPRQVLVGGMAALALLMLMQIMLVFRLWEGGIVSNLLSGRAFESVSLEEGPKVDNNFNSLVRVVDLIPEFQSHTGWDAIVYWAVRPIPRAIWPGKPINPGINIPWHLKERWGEGFTLTISAVGDWYIAFGVISVIVAGVMMGFIGGRLVMAWMRPRLRDTVLYSLGAMCLFIGLRSYLELILMSYPILALLLIERYTVRRGAKETSLGTAPA